MTSSANQKPKDLFLFYKQLFNTCLKFMEFNFGIK